MLTLYGLKTCDTCRNAVKALEASGKQVVFRDVRSDPLSPEILGRFLDAFGEKLVNTRSTTWRNFSEQERQASPARLLADHPTLMKRPVIDDGQDLFLGWSEAERSRYLG